MLVVSTRRRTRPGSVSPTLPAVRGHGVRSTPHRRSGRRRDAVPSISAVIVKLLTCDLVDNAPDVPVPKRLDTLMCLW
jgi:hypothetical protein